MTDDEFDDDLIDEDILEETNGDEDHVENTVKRDSDGTQEGVDATEVRESVEEKASSARQGLSDAKESLKPQARAAGERAGEISGRALGMAIAFAVSLGSTLLYTVTKFLPFIGEKFWKSAIETCTVRYQKAAGADVVNFVHREQGKVEPVATNWQGGDDTGDKPGWMQSAKKRCGTRAPRGAASSASGRRTSSSATRPRGAPRTR